MPLGEKIVLWFFPWIESNTIETYKKSFESHFNCHAYLLFNISCINDFPSIYLDFFSNWKNISHPIHKLHREFRVNICGLINL